MPKFNLVNQSKILLYACPTTLSHTMGNQQLRWPTNDLLERNLRFWLLSLINVCSSNVATGICVISHGVVFKAKVVVLL